MFVALCFRCHVFDLICFPISMIAHRLESLSCLLQIEFQRDVEQKELH